MSNVSYKGYTGTIEVSVEDDCLHGKILFIDDIITYEGNGVSDIKVSFEEAVDRYLAYCKTTGKSANKPYSGTFNVRVGQEFHRKAAEISYHNGVSLNDFVTQSIKFAIEQNGVIRVEHTHNLNITIQEFQTVRATMEKPSEWKESYATH